MGRIMPLRPAAERAADEEKAEQVLIARADRLADAGRLPSHGPAPRAGVTVYAVSTTTRIGRSRARQALKALVAAGRAAAIPSPRGGAPTYMLAAKPAADDAAPPEDEKDGS